jgi:hypothetical protein
MRSVTGERYLGPQVLMAGKATVSKHRLQVRDFKKAEPVKYKALRASIAEVVTKVICNLLTKSGG